MKRSLNFVVCLGLVMTLAILAPAQSQQTSQPNPADAKIQQQVQKTLAERGSSRNVQAAVDDRIVLLTGSVDVYADKLRTAERVRHVDGVDGVRNHITVDTEKIPDAELTQSLADRLRYDRIDQGVMFNNFTLNVHDGSVTIGGVARTDSDAASALSIVQHAKGVTDVTDNIQVAPTSIDDDRIRVQVARAIYGSPGLQKYSADPQAPIRIVVVNGHVTLAGMVDNQMDKTMANMRARQVPGVFSVTNDLAVAGKSAENQPR